MARKLFSGKLPPFGGEIENGSLRESLSLLKQFTGKRKINILSWDKDHIAIPLKLAVDLPPLGTFEGLDIRKVEEVIFVLSLKDYPTKAPTVHTDRLDFPKNRLAHLYIAKEGMPSAFCYVRGSYNEWYANKRITDLVVRIKNWLRDAAAGVLAEDGDQFDPLRLEGYRGTIIYSYDTLAKLILEKQSFYANSNFALALFENTAKDKEFPSFRLEKLISTDDLQESLQKYIASIKELLEKKTFKVRKYHLGYILWSDTENTYKDYCVGLPRNWIDFKRFCSKFSINTAPLEEFIAGFTLNFFLEMPIITAIKRPKRLIGFSSFVEFVNFYVELKDEDKGEKGLINNIPVHFQAHNEPLTTSKAQMISGVPVKFNGAAFIGCGALGSKVAMHFIRSGTKGLLFLDKDKLSPHNLVRHALLPESEGANKAVALMNAATSMFRNEETTDTIIGLPFSGRALLNGLLAVFKKDLHWLFDFTASESFFQTLILPQKDFDHVRICRGNISDHGNLGVLLFEGVGRNPRIDDLQVLLFSSYKNSDLVSGWLRREFEHDESVHLLVGVGCNSETIILADDIVSSHAAYFSMVIRRQVEKSAFTDGEIYLHQIDKDDPNITTRNLTISPLVVTQAVNDSSWEIRIKAGIVEAMKSEMGLSMPNETGGIFIGTVNYKSKTIHVVDLIYAPPDSQTNCACFFRGIDGLPEKVKDVNIDSGNQLGYIGEWHSHPSGPNSMSTVDANTVKRFKEEFENSQTPLPVFLTIITPTNLLCYVY